MKAPFSTITSETLEERKNQILMKHDISKNSENLDESEEFKHELSSSLEELRPGIKDTVSRKLYFALINRIICPTILFRYSTGLRYLTMVRVRLP